MGVSWSPSKPNRRPEAPKSGQVDSKKRPKAPKLNPKGAQETLKMGQDGAKRGQEGGKMRPRWGQKGAYNKKVKKMKNQ